MAKTYPNIGTFSPGQVLTAAVMTNIDTNLDNFRVPALCVLNNSSFATTGTATKVTFGSSAEIDTEAPSDPMFSSGSNTRITIRTAGLYLITATVYNGSASATGYFELMKNNATVGSTTSANNPNYAPSGTINYTASLVATDYVETRVSVTSNQNFAVRMSALWLGQVS